MKKLSWLGAIFVLGGIAGIIGSLWLAPILADISPFSKIGWLAHSKDGVTIVNKSERVTISQNQAFQEGIAKIGPSLVGVRSFAKQGIAAEGNGFILTSDGLVTTAAVLVPENVSAVKVLLGQEEVGATVLKRDVELGVALLKIEKTNLTPVATADTSAVILGQELFLVALNVRANPVYSFVSRGYVKAKEQGKQMAVDFFAEAPVANGSASINEKGEVVGLNLINVSGGVSLVPISAVTSLLSQ